MTTVWFLDIDGVIKGWKKHPRYSTAWEHVIVPAEHGGKQVKFDIHYDPAVIEFINEMSQHVSIVWLTTWNEQAASVFAPAVGIKPVLPNGFMLSNVVIPSEPLSSRNFLLKKNQAAQKLVLPGGLFHGANVIWTDDDLDKQARRAFTSLLKNQGNDACLIRNYPSDGLRPEEMQRIRAFVSKSA